jgi:hypothetical protein
MLLATACVLVITAGCSKEIITGDDIVGKWRMESRYQGYLNGGNFQWNDVPDEQKSFLEFSEDGSFKEYDGANDCSGTYAVASPKKLDVVSTCQLYPYVMNISKLTGKTLIIDWQGREGVIRDKYRRVK